MFIWKWRIYRTSNCSPRFPIMVIFENRGLQINCIMVVYYWPWFEFIPICRKKGKCTTQNVILDGISEKTTSIIINRERLRILTALKRLHFVDVKNMFRERLLPQYGMKTVMCDRLVTYCEERGLELRNIDRIFDECFLYGYYNKREVGKEKKWILHIQMNKLC